MSATKDANPTRCFGVLTFPIDKKFITKSGEEKSGLQAAEELAIQIVNGECAVVCLPDCFRYETHPVPSKVEEKPAR